ncbi:hypothetical protein ACVWYG_003987, partial [Pedobacter sp. UYEF25]
SRHREAYSHLFLKHQTASAICSRHTRFENLRINGIAYRTIVAPHSTK